MRGQVPLTEKEQADRKAIDGLRNTADSVGRLHLVAAFGFKLGKRLCELLNANTSQHDSEGASATSWVSIACDAIGSSDPTCEPPAEGVVAVRKLLVEATNMTEADANTVRLTKVDAQLLEACRVASSDPENQVGLLLKGGAPAGIFLPIVDPGISPSCPRPSDVQPEDR